MKIRMGELVHFLPKSAMVNQRMLRKWVDDGILCPAGGAGEKSHFRFDKFEISYAIIAAHLYGCGVKGLGLTQAMLWMRSRFNQTACHPIETALNFVRHANLSMPVNVGIVHAAKCDDDEPLYSVLTEPGEFSTDFPCMLVLNLVQVLKPLAFRL